MTCWGCDTQRRDDKAQPSHKPPLRSSRSDHPVGPPQTPSKETNRRSVGKRFRNSTSSAAVAARPVTQPTQRPMQASTNRSCCSAQPTGIAVYNKHPILQQSSNIHLPNFAWRGWAVGEREDVVAVPRLGDVLLWYKKPTAFKTDRSKTELATSLMIRICFVRAKMQWRSQK